MTMPAWPFALVHPPGYADGIVPTGAELQLLQQQSAASADGRLWTDVAAVKGYRYTALVLPDPMTPRTLIRDPSSHRWLIFGGSAGTVIWTVSGERWVGASSALGGMGSVMATVQAAAVNSAGVILCGGQPSIAATDKLRESTDGGNTWILRNIGASDTNIVNALAYSESLGLWFCSVGSTTVGAGVGVFTSPDRVTWTNRTSGSAAPRHVVVRDTPSPIILATQLAFSGSPGPNYFRSTDGVTWTTEAFPSSAAGVAQGCWSNALGAFFVAGADGVYTSTTGLTGSWTRIDTTWLAPAFDASIAAFGRLLIRGDGKASLDGGITWFSVLETTNVDLFVAATPFGVGFSRFQSGSPDKIDVYIGRAVGL